MSKKLDLTEKAHVDCYQLMTIKKWKDMAIRDICKRCGKNTPMIATGRKVYCRKTINKIEVKCRVCGLIRWVSCPDWWC